MTFSILIQGFAVVIVIGVVYSLWQTTRVFGGLIGLGLKWIGLGMIFFSLEALDRVLGNLSFIKAQTFLDPVLGHDVLFLVGLIFSGIGFSILTKIAKK